MRATASELALLAVVPSLWGSAFIAIRAGLLAGAPPFAFAEYRYVLATALVALGAVASRQPRPARRPFLVSALLGGVFLMGVYAALIYWGEQYTSGGLTSVLVSTAPVWTAIIALVLLPAERLGVLGWAGVGIGLSGVVLLFLPDLGVPHGGGVGALMAPLLAAASASAGAVLVRRSGVHAAGLWNLTGQLGVASLILLPLTALAPGGFSFPVTPLTLGTLLYLAVGSSAIAYGLFFVLLHRVGPARASMVAYLNPAVGLTVGWLALGESITPAELGGFGLILLAVALLQVERRRTASSAPTPVGPPSEAKALP
jgi:probable blue pigment (indigoidine) exporter